MKYLPNRSLTKFCGRIFETKYHLFVCTRKLLIDSFHARVAICKAFLWARMTDGTKTSATFLTLEEEMIAIVRVTNLGTDMSARHFRRTFVDAPSFRWEISYFASLLH